MKRAAALVVLAVSGACWIGPGPTRAEAVNYPQNGIVNPDPINKTPWANDGRVNAIVEIGNRVIVAGKFTSVRDAVAKITYTRTNIFAFDKTTLRVDAAFNPALNGTVEAMVASPDGQVIIAGRFTTVGGVSQRGVAKLNATTGIRDATFGGRVGGGNVLDIARSGNTIYLGGTFTTAVGVTRSKLAALNATTGALITSFNVAVANPRQGTSANVLKLDVTVAGDRMVVIGNFLTVAGQPRNQIALVDTSLPVPAVDSWETDRFVGLCAGVFDTYMRDVDISPDGQRFAVVTTGAYGWPPSLCDSASMWSTYGTGAGQQPTWVNYMGGDTLYSVAITNAAVYIGGHQRWNNNAYAGDWPGPGSVDRPGISALDPLTGVSLRWNPTRDRGVGAFSLVATADRLYVGHDTLNVGGEYHPRFAMFTMTGSTTNPTPTPIALPVRMHRAAPDGSLDRLVLDGTAVGPTGKTQATNAPIDFAQQRGSFFVNGDAYILEADGTFDRRSFDTTTDAFGTATDLVAAAAYAGGPPVEFDANVTSLAYSNGRIFYTRVGDNRIFWRWFALESGIVGSEVMVAYDGNAPNINGMEVAGGSLFVSTSDGHLWKVAVANNGTVDWAARTLIDAVGDGSGYDWATGGDFFVTATTDTVPAPPVDPDPCGVGYFKARYFNGTTLSGPADTVRCERRIDYDYADGAPAGTGLGADNYSVIWSGDFDFGGGGPTEFISTTDDGVRLFVDGTLVIDHWFDQGPTAYAATVDLTPGVHKIRMEFYESGGGAYASLTGYPVTPLPPVVCAANEFKAEYFNGTALAGDPDTVQCEAAVDYDWGDGAPAGTTLGADGFSVRWTRSFTAVADGTANFTVTTDDGVRLYVDNVLVIDSWFDRGPATDVVAVPLLAGNHTVVMEYYESGGGAVAQFATDAF